MSTLESDKTHEAPSFSNSQPLTTWRDFTFTPPIFFGLVIAPAALSVWMVARLIGQYVSVGITEHLIGFYFFVVVFSLIILKFFRTFFPIPEGVYSYRLNKREIFLFNNTSFFLVVPLGFLFNGFFIPPNMKKDFYRLLGCKMGKGMMVLGGKLEDPHWVSLGDNVIIGEGSVVGAHVASNAEINGDRFLTIGHIEIGNNTIIGNNCTVMPGAKIGDGAMLMANSFIPLNTEIPCGEIWSGNPAKKVGEIPRCGG